jgi:hypothetical protein
LMTSAESSQAGVAKLVRPRHQYRYRRTGRLIGQLTPFQRCRSVAQPQVTQLNPSQAHLLGMSCITRQVGARPPSDNHCGPQAGGAGEHFASRRHLLCGANCGHPRATRPGQRAVRPGRYLSMEVNTMKRFVRTAILAAVTPLLAVAYTGGVAEAAAHCAAGGTCGFDGTSYTSTSYRNTSGHIADLGTVGFDNKFSSVSDSTSSSSYQGVLRGQVLHDDHW